MILTCNIVDRERRGGGGKMRREGRGGEGREEGRREGEGQKRREGEEGGGRGLWTFPITCTLGPSPSFAVLIL